MHGPRFIVGSIAARFLILIVVAIVVIGFGHVPIGVLVGLRNERRPCAEEIAVDAPCFGSIRCCDNRLWVGSDPAESAAAGVEAFLRASRKNAVPVE